MTATPAASFRRRFGADARTIASLGAPLLINNLSMAGMAFADTVMGGRLGGRALAAIAVGVSYYWVFLIIGIGVMMSLSPLVAHANGRGGAAEVGDYARHGAWIGAVLATLLVLGLAAVRPVLTPL